MVNNQGQIYGGTKGACPLQNFFTYVFNINSMKITFNNVHNHY